MRQLQFAFDRLVAIGHRTHGEAHRLPFGGGEFFAQQLGRAVFDHDFAFEVEP